MIEVNKTAKIVVILIITIGISIISFRLGHETKPDLNTASYDKICEALYEDEQYDGKRAKTIFDNRPYLSWQEVDGLDGIGEDTIEELQSSFKISY